MGPAGPSRPGSGGWKKRILVGTGIYLGATLLAFLDTRISLTIFVLISLFYIAPPKTDRHLRA